MNIFLHILYTAICLTRIKSEHCFDHFALLGINVKYLYGSLYFGNFYLSLFFIFKIKNALKSETSSVECDAFIFCSSNWHPFPVYWKTQKLLSEESIYENCRGRLFGYDSTPDELIKSMESHTCQNFPLSFKVSDIFSPVWSHVFWFKSRINETFQTSS